MIAKDRQLAPYDHCLGFPAFRAKPANDYQTSAIALDPKYAQAHNNLGRIYLGQEKYPEAIACARAAIAANPRSSNAHTLLGLVLQRNGDIPGARAALTEAARLDKHWAGMVAKLPPPDVAPPPRAKGP